MTKEQWKLELKMSRHTWNVTWWLKASGPFLYPSSWTHAIFFCLPPSLLLPLSVRQSPSPSLCLSLSLSPSLCLSLSPSLCSTNGNKCLSSTIFQVRPLWNDAHRYNLLQCSKAQMRLEHKTEIQFPGGSFFLGNDFQTPLLTPLEPEMLWLSTSPRHLRFHATSEHLWWMHILKWVISPLASYIHVQTRNALSMNKVACLCSWQGSINTAHNNSTCVLCFDILYEDPEITPQNAVFHLAADTKQTCLGSRLQVATEPLFNNTSWCVNQPHKHEMPTQF